MEEEKTTQLDQEKPETEVEESPVEAAAESSKTEEEDVAAAGTAVRERRGRLIMAGLAAATVATLVAVVVTGIFQFTSKWLTQCPRDRTVNGPSSVLWKDVLSDKGTQQPLGVSAELLQITKLKTPAPVEQESGGGKDENK